MAYTDTDSRAYVEKRFPLASKGEHDKIVMDWVTKHKQSEGIASDFEQRVRPLQGLRVLDAGSGNGGIGIALAKRGANVEGVDIEEELVAIARAEAKEQNSPATFTWYEGTTLPFEDKSFDAAFSVSVIEHVETPARYFSEILRVLKPGGVLYLAFPNKLDPIETHTGLFGLSYLPLPLAKAYARAMKHNPVEDNNLHFYSYWNMLKLLKAASGERAWKVLEEKGKATGSAKRVLKKMLRTVGVPHQALLPHVMLIVEAS
jgi:ubiquinone/menaquinone biosynthesis C-methylase UbiE